MTTRSGLAPRAPGLERYREDSTFPLIRPARRYLPSQRKKLLTILGLVDEAGRARLRRGREDGRLDLARPHDVKDARAADDQIIGDDAPVAAPPDRLGAHDGAAPARAEVHEMLQAAAEIVGSA